MTWAQQPDRNFGEVEQLLPLIRFPLMTQQELQVSPASLLPPSPPTLPDTSSRKSGDHFSAQSPVITSYTQCRSKWIYKTTEAR